MEERNEQESKAEIIFSHEFDKIQKTLFELELLHQKPILYDKITYLGKAQELLENLTISRTRNLEDWEKERIEKLEKKWSDATDTLYEEYYEKTYSYPKEMEKKYVNAVETLIDIGQARKSHLKAMQDILNRTLEECYPSNDEKQNLRGKAFEIMLELKDRPENAFVNRKEARKMLQIVDQGVFPEGRDNAKSLGR